MAIVWEPETKTIKDMKWKDNVFDIVIKKFNAGEETEIQDGCTEIKVVGKVQVRKMEVGKGKLLTVLKGIMTAPFPHATLADIIKMPSEIFDILYDEITKFNEIDEEQKKSSSDGPSGNQESAIPS